MVTIKPKKNNQPIKAKIEIQYESAWSYSFIGYHKGTIIRNYEGSTNKRDNECPPTPSPTPFHQVHCLELGVRADFDVDSWTIVLFNQHLQKIHFAVSISWYQLNSETNNYDLIPFAQWTRTGETDPKVNNLTISDTSRYV